jgi:hypothetical protein
MDQNRKARLSQQPIERIANWLHGIGSWAEEHLRFIGWSASFILAILVIGIGLSMYRSFERESGLEAMRSGLAEMSNDQIASAIPYLESAADGLDGNARQLALLKLGEAYKKQDQPSKARQAYEAILNIESEQDFLDFIEHSLVQLRLKTERKEDRHYLVQFALVELGKTAEGDGDTDLARSRYTEAAEFKGPGQSEALLAAAKILEQANDTEGAQSYYQKFIESGVNSPLKELVEQKVD